MLEDFNIDLRPGFGHRFYNNHTDEEVGMVRHAILRALKDGMEIGSIRGTYFEGELLDVEVTWAPEDWDDLRAGYLWQYQYLKDALAELLELTI